VPTRSEFRAEPKGDERVSTFNVQEDEKECEQALEGAGDPSRYAFSLAVRASMWLLAPSQREKNPIGAKATKITPIPIANDRMHVASNDRTLIAPR
jgi:hypothetical protein